MPEIKLHKIDYCHKATHKHMLEMLITRTLEEKMIVDVNRIGLEYDRAHDFILWRAIAFNKVTGLKEEMTGAMTSYGSIVVTRINDRYLDSNVMEIN